MLVDHGQGLLTFGAQWVDTARLGGRPEVVAWIDQGKLMTLTKPAESELGSPQSGDFEQDGALRNRCGVACTPPHLLPPWAFPLLWETLMGRPGVSS